MQRRVRKPIAWGLVGVLIGVLFLTPVGAHVNNNAKHVGRHAWKKFIKKRVFTRKQANRRFARANDVLALEGIAQALEGDVQALEGDVEALREDGVALERTIVVPALGTEAERGQVLRDALGGITDASEGNRWLVRLEPGTYDIGMEHLDVPNHVDLEGSGRDTSRILCDCSHSPNEEIGFGPGSVLFLVSGSEVRSLTVANDGGIDGFYRRGIDIVGPVRLLDVGVEVTGGVTDSTTTDGHATGIRSAGEGVELDAVHVEVDSPGAFVARGIRSLTFENSIDIRDSEVTVFNDVDIDGETPQSYGIVVDASTDVHVEDTDVDVSSVLGGLADNYGVRNRSSVVRYVDVRSHVSDGGDNWAFHNEDAPSGSPAILRGVEALSIGSGDRYVALENVDADAVIDSSRLIAKGPTNPPSEAYAMKNTLTGDGSQQVAVTGSTLEAMASKGGSVFGIDTDLPSESFSSFSVVRIQNSEILSMRNDGTPERWLRADANDGTSITLIAASLIAGSQTDLEENATVDCFGVWDLTPTFHDNSCPGVP